MPIFFLTLKLYLPYCHSLKEKRNLLKSCIKRTQEKLNISVAEVDVNNSWQSSQIGIVWISGNPNSGQKLTEKIKNYINSHYPEIELTAEIVEVL